MKIVLPDCKTITNGDIDLNIFSEFGEVIQYPMTNPYELPEIFADADVILCNKIPLNEKTLCKAEHLKYIGLFATGYNNVDIEYAKKNGITVCNAGSYSTNAVAQHTMAFVLNHFNRITEYDSFVKDGGWVKSSVFSPFIYDMDEMEGKVLGIIGYGSIGEKVAELAKAFGMKVLAYNRNHKSDDVEFVELNELLEKSDVVTVHCPLNDESERMFSKSTFSKMKQGAYFINTARGGIMVEEDLYDALESGKLSGAAIDVLDTEPMSPECKLLKAKNIIITPHVAWAPLATRQRLMGIVADNLRCYLNGKPKNVVS